MQLAGKACGICNQNVLLDSEATWCARCSTVLHRECLANSGEMCRTCQQPYERAESHFVFSQMCPECFRPNDPPRAQCASCTARTQWDTQAAYAEFLEHMKDTSRVYVLRGCVQLIGGGLCIVALAAMVYISRRPGFVTLGLFVLGFITLTANGIVTLMRSRQIARFR